MQQRRKRHLQKKLLIVALIILIFVVAVISMGIGPVSISWIQVVKIILSPLFQIEQTWSSQEASVVLTLRAPRIIGAILVGAALAVSGSTYQGIFKNPLVSPDLLGVSAGACVGASFAILQHWNGALIQICAFLSGLFAVLLTCLIPKLFRNRSNLMLVLSGVIVGGIMNSIQGIYKYIADPEDELQSIVYWTMGSLSSVRKSDLLFIIIPTLICLTVLMLMRWKINLMTLGDAEAKSMGVNIRVTRMIAVLCSTVLTACAVCLGGTIGWIGLVVPHIGRLLVGQDNKYLIPVSMLSGSVFLSLVDTIARNLASSEIPLSILTGLIGGPIFIIILSKRGLREH